MISTHCSASEYVFFSLTRTCAIAMITAAVTVDEPLPPPPSEKLWTTVLCVMDNSVKTVCFIGSMETSDFSKYIHIHNSENMLTSKAHYVSRQSEWWGREGFGGSEGLVKMVIIRGKPLYIFVSTFHGKYLEQRLLWKPWKERLIVKVSQLSLLIAAVQMFDRFENGMKVPGSLKAEVEKCC